uniref:Uncharacterized protein n=1 Tax=Glossina pallidipes TaxID=7398 RepID=A0A1A9ZJJ6_GLOPL
MIRSIQIVTYELRKNNPTPRDDKRDLKEKKEEEYTNKNATVYSSSCYSYELFSDIENATLQISKLFCCRTVESKSQRKMQFSKEFSKSESKLNGVQNSSEISETKEIV